MQGSICAAFEPTFPYGLVMPSPKISPLNDYDRSTKENQVQARDEAGVLMWQFDVIDLDPDARTRTFKVKIAAEHQPVPPDAMAGMPLRPVVLEGLQITPWIKSGDRPTIAYSLRCTGISAPKNGMGPVAASGVKAESRSAS